MGWGPGKKKPDIHKQTHKTKVRKEKERKENKKNKKEH